MKNVKIRYVDEQGWTKLIKGEALIRVSRVEKSSEINKRACPIIRHLRVLRYSTNLSQILPLRL